MSAFNQLSMALGAGTLETNIALARINFDFSLYKVAAPTEYQGLSEVLSVKRRETAESGSSHITARKLNALFEQDLPPIPNIIRTYGLRSSEVARLTKDEETRRSVAQRFFPEHSGIDGTTVWAAATSGDKAIAVHLLACMLARLWPASEATSIWVELVAERKKRIRGSQQNFGLPTLAAMEVSISREHLSEWDAGARAWLRAADKALRKQQTQLMLIIGNVDLAVNSKIDVYASVLQAWTSSLTAVENMMSGTAQMVHSGAILLALSAWHLYPNMFVLGKFPKSIDMDDALFNPAGVLTLGIQNTSEEKGDGVYWSLPLAYHRYYGPSVTSLHATGSHTSRISFDQLIQIVLGCVLRDCGFEKVQSHDLVEFFKLLHETLEDGTRVPEASGSRSMAHMPPPWIGIFAKAAAEHSGLEDTELESLKRLVAYGKRRVHVLGKLKCPMKPAFGIGRPEVFLSLQNSPESAISSIRHLIRGQKYNDQRYLIRYKEAEGVFSYASAYHLRRWGYSSVYHERIQEEKREMIKYQDINISAQYLIWYDPPHQFPRERDPYIIQTARQSVEDAQTIVAQKDDPTRRQKNKKKSGKRSSPCVILQCLFGDPDSVALYGPTNHKDHLVFEVEDILNALRSKHLEPEKVKKYLTGSECFTPDYVQVQDSLAAIVFASKIYSCIPDATVSIDIASHNLGELRCIPHTTKGRVVQSVSPELVDTFACIASFELGSPNISIDGMDEVIALSTGNSIYISQHLLCDPSEDYRCNEVRRIEGNIGKSGLALLIPPKDPMFKRLNGDTWNLINHSDFDGKFEDNFGSTSLHLSFTNYEFPVDLGVRSVYHHEAYFVEALVSIYDKGSWIADLDILAAFGSPDLTKLTIGRHRPGSGCRLEDSIDGPIQPLVENTTVSESGTAIAKFHATSIDSWNELLDSPEDICVLRAHGNWISRLSATVLSSQLGYQIFLVPFDCTDICWQCVDTLIRLKQGKRIVIL
jgi:hypothetical protein